MNLARHIKRPIAVILCMMIACIAGALLWRVAQTAHTHARSRAIAKAIEATPEFSHVHVTPRQKSRDLEVNGTVQTREEFSSLTNMLRPFASDMSIQVDIEWPTGRDYNREPGMVVTRLGERGVYAKIGDVLSCTLFISFSFFLFVLVATFFWSLWKKIRVGEKRARDFVVLVFAPFISTALAILSIWYFPSMISQGPIWPIPWAFLCSVCLLTYCFRVLVKGPYRTSCLSRTSHERHLGISGVFGIGIIVSGVHDVLV